jgi:hypothetical protein
MHAIPVRYNGHILIPLAAGERGRYASMIIVTEPDGARRASGILDYFSDADDACRFAIAYGKAEVDGQGCPLASESAATTKLKAVVSEETRNVFRRAG